MKKQTLFLLLSLWIGLSGCCKEDIPELPERTVLVYMIANNSLDHYATINLQDIMNVATAEQLNGGNLLVLYAPRNETPVLLQIKETEGVVKKYSIKDYNGQNVAEPAVMQDVIREVAEKFPAQHYGLIMWGHGTGWLPGNYQNQLRSFGPDGTTYLEIDQLARGLPDRFFDFILFDACYMANVECAYELRNKTEYILASPTETMGAGWPYTEIIPQLFEKGLHPKQLGETFQTFYRNYKYPYATVSLIHTPEIENLRGIVREIIRQKNEEEIFSVDRSQMQRLEYLYRSPGFLYDLSDFIQQLATDEQYHRYVACMDQVVVYKDYTPNAYYYYGKPQSVLPINRFCGMTVYVPLKAEVDINDWYKKRVSWYQAIYQ